MIGYLAAFFVSVSIAAGSLVFLMVSYLGRATWFLPIRRVVEAAVVVLPIFLLLFLPIALRLSSIYPWAQSTSDLNPQQAASLGHARVWFEPSFFIARSYVYLLTWCVLAFLLRRASLMQDPSPPDRSRIVPRTVSAVGLPLTLVTISFAGFDWLMSLQPGWTSDAFGLYVAAGSFAGSVGAIAVFVYFADRAGFFERSAIAKLTDAHVHALGRIMLVSVLFWAYIGFCQFLLIWIGDLPSEIPFYDERREGFWGWASALLVLTHFVVPFLLLLSRPLKRRIASLACVGALLLVAHALDVLWIVIPSAHRNLSVLDVASTAGILLIFVGATVSRYRAVPPAPLHDPDLARAIRYESP